MMTISIITPISSMDAINNVIDHQDFGCTFYKYVYDQLEDIPDIYEDCKDKCDVIFFSGELGYHFALTNIKNISLPCNFIFYETKHVLSIFLNFMLENPSIPLNRVFVDFLSPVNNYMNIANYIEKENLPQCFEHTNYNYLEIGKQIQKLRAEDKIDYVLMRSVKNVELITKLGLGYKHILPTEEIISESLNNAINSVKLMNKNWNKVLLLLKPIYQEQWGIYDREYHKITMYKLLVDFRLSTIIQFSIDSTTDYFELRLEPSSMNIITTIQGILMHLNRNTDMEFRLGVGCSHTLHKSRYLAETALQESIHFGKNDGFLAHGEDGKITGPLSVDNSPSYNYSNTKANQYAKKHGISEQHIAKIIGIFQMDSTTILSSTMLSKWLNITTRSCNRILQQLLESCLIVEIEPETSLEKGRPAKQYKFITKHINATFF